MFNMTCWYLSRYLSDRRRLRAMTRDYSRPWTGRTALVVAILIAAIAPWLLIPPTFG